MTRARIVFAGPSVPESLRRNVPGIRFLPPVRLGDVARAVLADAAAIGIIDGVFETERSVWHREILWALDKGVPVYGAASMGALRAIETEPFGMRGLGTVFGWYKRGILQDDEEVAVRHAPQELGYQALTEATVNVRASLLKALEAGVATREEVRGALKLAQEIHYKERSRAVLLAAWQAHSSLQRLSDWLGTRWVDQKAADAAILINLFNAADQPAKPPPSTFRFRETVHWQHFLQHDVSRLN